MIRFEAELKSVELIEYYYIDLIVDRSIDRLILVSRRPFASQPRSRARSGRLPNVRPQKRAAGRGTPFSGQTRKTTRVSSRN
jgi:hypothetical protein